MSGVCPASWAPLADADPIGGDVAAVGREARRYQDMAVELRDQVARLRRIAGQEELLGRTADKLREAAEDLSGKMADTVGRFERVGSALQEWVPHLEHAQDVTLIALRRAQEAQHQQAAYAPSVVMGQPSPESPTDAQVAAERRRVGLHDEAAADLHAARARFDEAVDEHHRRARAIAARLEEAADDQLTDSGWEQFKGWVHQHAEQIKKITELLSYVATALAFVAIFLPGINVFVLLGMGLAVLAGHSLLLASGDGSWADILLDVVALATLGVGTFAASGLRAAQGATRAAAVTAAKKAATRQTRNYSKAMKLLQRRLGDASPPRRAVLQRQIRVLKSVRPPRPAQAAREVRDAVLPLSGDPVGRLGAVVRAGGDVDNARNAADVARWASRYPSSGVQRAAESIGRPLILARSAFGLSFSADLSDKVLGSSDWAPSKPYSKVYVEAKEAWR